MKKVGIVGGIGPESTISYYHDIVYGVQVRIGHPFYPPVSIESIDLFEWVR
ncbi:MAG: aspartate racemase, partial [Lachnospiraceae bacterium]|nr:aspartate racemase [Lachnospiraceae bacterium]